MTDDPFENGSEEEALREYEKTLSIVNHLRDRLPLAIDDYKREAAAQKSASMNYVWRHLLSVSDWGNLPADAIPEQFAELREIVLQAYKKSAEGIARPQQFFDLTTAYEIMGRGGASTTVFALRLRGGEDTPIFLAGIDETGNLSTATMNDSSPLLEREGFPNFKPVYFGREDFTARLVEWVKENANPENTPRLGLALLDASDSLKKDRAALKAAPTTADNFYDKKAQGILTNNEYAYWAGADYAERLLGKLTTTLSSAAAVASAGKAAPQDLQAAYKTSAAATSLQDFEVGEKYTIEASKDTKLTAFPLHLRSAEKTATFIVTLSPQGGFGLIEQAHEQTGTVEPRMSASRLLDELLHRVHGHLDAAVTAALEEDRTREEAGFKPGASPRLTTGAPVI